jgi:hypothetical protein
LLQNWGAKFLIQEWKAAGGGMKQCSYGSYKEAQDSGLKQEKVDDDTGPQINKDEHVALV